MFEVTFNAWVIARTMGGRLDEYVLSEDRTAALTFETATDARAFLCENGFDGRAMDEEDMYVINDLTGEVLRASTLTPAVMVSLN